jgi:thiol-disulfide isomerase/thioredoxin
MRRKVMVSRRFTSDGSVATLLAGTVVVVFVLLAASRSMAAGGLEGQRAQTFSMVDMAEQPQSLENMLKEGPVLLDFWSIYCVACIQELPSVIELYEKYRGDGLRVLAINLDSFGARRVKRFIAGMKFTIPFPVIIDKKREIAMGYKISVLPTTVLIGKRGKIEMYHIGYIPGDEELLETKIKEALK